MDYREKISHLNNEQIENLIYRYYNGENTTNLIKEYNLNVRSSDLYKIFPPIVHSDILCPYCNIPMISQRVSRSSYSEDYINSICPQCRHKYFYECDCCECKKIKENIRLEEENTKRMLIIDLAEFQRNNIDFQHYELLSLKDRIYISSLLRCGLSEDFDIIKPYVEFREKLSPTDSFSFEMIRYLYKNRILIIHMDSSISGFIFKDEEIDVIKLDKASWELNILVDNKPINDLNVQTILYPKIINETEKNIAFDIWKEIALEECKEYLLFKLNEYNFEFNIGNKTIAVFSHLLENFSVSQILSFIWSGIKNSVAFYHQKSITKKHAANYAITSIERQGERALVENWTVSKYRRDYNCPQSMIADVLFNCVLKIGEKGFNERPHIDLIY
jgi:hypothetical protein